MDIWLETVAVILIAFSGIFLGRVFSGLRKPWWVLGYSVPLVLIIVLVTARFSDVLSFSPPFFWFTTGRMKFVILSLAATMGLTTPLSRLPRKFEKVVTCILMTVVVVWFSVLPFLVPALMQGRLLNLQTLIDSNGICLQTTDYTCGPAAAVTALRRLGLSAEEGQIAVLSRTSPVAGTPLGSLYTALQNQYGAQGLKCRYRRFGTIAELRDAEITLATVKDAFLSSHCVAVLEVTERTVTIADPVSGLRSMSYEQFEKVWQFSGIALKREFTENI